MKKTLSITTLSLLAVACSLTNNIAIAKDINMPVLSPKAVVVRYENANDSLQRRVDHGKTDTEQKIEKDKTESFEKLKKSMTPKAYKRADSNVKKIPSEDIIYTLKGGGWYAVE